MKVHPVRTTALLLCLLLAPLPAFAADPVFSYDYLELGHQRLTPQTGDSGSGTYADFSYTILDKVQFRGGYDRYTYPLDLQYKDYSIGISGETAINSSTDAYTDLLYLNNRYTHHNASSTDDGYRVELGLRHRAWAWVELDGYVAHDYLTDSFNEAGVALWFTPIPQAALGLGYSHDSLYNNVASLKLRVYF